MTRTRMTVGWCLTFAVITGGVALANDPGRVLSHGDKDDGWEAVADGRVCVECPVVTLQQGERSLFHFEDPGFMGLTALIRDRHSWERFWSHHTHADSPPPPVNFREWRVIVAIQGVQTTSCGPMIEIARVERCGPSVMVGIVDDERPGACDALSNPFHIVRVPLRCLGRFTSVGFLSHAPGLMPGAVTGRVLGELEDGEVIPLAEAMVRLSRPNDPDFVVETLTNNDGFYHIPDLRPGPYAASAFAPGFMPVHRQPLHVPPGETVEMSFLLHPGPVEGCAIVGQVRGGPSLDESQPLPCAHVMLFAAPPDPPDDSQPPILIRETATNCDGIYEFHELPPGAYHVVAEAPGFIPEGADVFLPPDNPVTIEQNFLLQPQW